MDNRGPLIYVGPDDPEKACDVVLTDEMLLDYLSQIERKTLDYLDNLTDEMLSE